MTTLISERTRVLALATGAIVVGMVSGGLYSMSDAAMRAGGVYTQVARAVAPLTPFVPASRSCAQWCDVPEWVSPLPASIGGCVTDDQGNSRGYAEMLLSEGRHPESWYGYAALSATVGLALSGLYWVRGCGPRPAVDRSRPLRFASLWASTALMASLAGLFVPIARLADGAWYALYSGAAIGGAGPLIAIRGWLSHGPLAGAIVLALGICAWLMLGRIRVASLRAVGAGWLPGARSLVVRDGRCLHCGYDASHGRICPECGSPDPHTLSGVFLTVWHARLALRFGRRAPLVLTIGIAIALMALPLWGACLDYAIGALSSGR